MRHPAVHIAPPAGKLGVLLVGLGAVSTTFIAGVLAIEKGLAAADRIADTDGYAPAGKAQPSSARPPFAILYRWRSLEDLVFGAWDIFEENAFEAARTAGVLEPALLAQLREPLTAIKPHARRVRSAIREPARWTQRQAEAAANATSLSSCAPTFAASSASTKSHRLVVAWCGSTEAFMAQTAAHQSLQALEHAIDSDDDAITPSMMYAYAAVSEGIPYINAAPNLSVDTPALVELANEQHVPVAGKDLKTGQTLLKTIIAPGLKARLLGVSGWYSTNILGNRDGEVLDDPQCFRTKEVSKKGVLDHILQPQLYPQLYGNLCHQVQINYYPPRGDNKEGWDNIDLFGWLNYPMQLKVNFLCRDSILAAPLVLDLALFLDLAARAQRQRHPGVAVILFQEPDACARPVSGARSVHTIDEARRTPCANCAARSWSLTWERNIMADGRARRGRR